MILQDFIECDGRTYEVNSISMSDLDQCLNPLLTLRNELFRISAVGETMIWAVNDDKARVDPILHCQRYHKITSMERNHSKIVNWLKQGKTTFFNGDGYPFNKEE